MVDSGRVAGHLRCIWLPYWDHVAGSYQVYGTFICRSNVAGDVNCVATHPYRYLRQHCYQLSAPQALGHDLDSAYCWLLCRLYFACDL